MYGENFSGKEIKGIFTIKKNSTQTESPEFTFLQLSKTSATLNIKKDERLGNSLSYEYDTKKFELYGNEYKAKKTKKNRRHHFKWCSGLCKMA